MFGSCAGNGLGASVNNGMGELYEARWCWLFGVYPIQDRDR